MIDECGRRAAQQRPGGVRDDLLHRCAVLGAEVPLEVDRGLAEGNLEYKSRLETEAQPVAVGEILSFIQNRIRR